MGYASAQNLSCAEVKQRYKNDGCCGVPSKHSSMVAYSPPRVSMSDQCQCIGDLIRTAGQYQRFTRATMLEALANKTILQQYSEFMTGKGYAAEYGLDCAAHDSNEEYCKAGGDNQGEPWCPEHWCYTTASACEGSKPTSFFKGTV